VVLTGSGKSFCSGADLKAAAKNPDQSTRRTARTLLHDFQPILECITRLDKPVIAAVNGGAIGVGMSFALACDFLVMAENAYLLAPFVNIGLIPDGGTAWFLTRRIGYGRALEILMEGQKLEARRCHELGLANRIVAADGLREGALAWAAQLAARAPLAMALTKRIARLSLTTGIPDLPGDDPGRQGSHRRIRREADADVSVALAPRLRRLIRRYRMACAAGILLTTNRVASAQKTMTKPRPSHSPERKKGSKGHTAAQ
jgi:2-(1,2-epoxy-1,2-dihydrophenyl)acetyl-CoA isomerase